MQKQLQDNILNKIANTSSCLLSLISFLQENDPKFKDFELFSYVNLSVHLNDNETGLFYITLKECNKFSIADIPNLEQFQEMLIEKGIDKNKITLDIVKRFLNSFIFQFTKYNNPYGFVAFIIINKEKIK